jgi:phospholipid/cholesterol/gamma-HCH transport system substrate-binding protein
MRKIWPLPSARDLNRIWVGVTCIILVSAVVAMAFAIGTLGIFSNTYELSAVFPETGGLKAGQKVRMAGVPIGKVTNVVADFQSGQVVVTFEVDKGTHLGKDTHAEVAISTLLGGQYLRLSGPVAQPYMETLPKDQRRIPLERTQVPFNVIAALGDTTRTIQSLDVNALNKIVNTLASTTEVTGPDVGSLVDNLTTLLTTLNARDVQFRQLVANSQQVTATLATKDQQIAALVDSANVLLDQLAARRDELASILGNGSQVVSTLANVIEGQRASLDTVLSDLHIFLEAVDRQLPNINEALAFAGPTFLNFAKAGHGGYFDVVGTAVGPTQAVTCLLAAITGGSC